MKVLVEFEFEDDRQGPLIALNAGQMYTCLSEIDMRIRNHFKHGDPADGEKVLTEVRSYVQDTLRRMEP